MHRDHDIGVVRGDVHLQHRLGRAAARSIRHLANNTSTDVTPVSQSADVQHRQELTRETSTRDERQHLHARGHQPRPERFAAAAGGHRHSACAGESALRQRRQRLELHHRGEHGHLRRDEPTRGRARAQRRSALWSASAPAELDQVVDNTAVITPSTADPVRLEQLEHRSDHDRRRGRSGADQDRNRVHSSPVTRATYSSPSSTTARVMPPVR